jgi:6-methylsalicylate decarboxylase
LQNTPSAWVDERMIDVHAHALPDAYRTMLISQGRSLPGMPASPRTPVARRPLAPIGDSAEDIATRLSLMDEAGVAIQLLSPIAAPYFDDADTAAFAAQTANESFASIASSAPGRFRFFASLPLPHVHESIREMDRALSLPGAVGITMECFCGSLSVADPYFDPLYDEMNERGVLLFLHPCLNGLCSRFINDWGLVSAGGATMEDAVLAMHFIVRGIPARFPNIRIIMPHLAGGIASSLKRLDNQLPYFVELRERPSETARRMWYDSCCHGSAIALRGAVDAFGADRILPGSDYPFLTLHEPYRATFSFMEDSGLLPSDLDAIRHANAARLLEEHS